MTNKWQTNKWRKQANKWLGKHTMKVASHNQFVLIKQKDNESMAYSFKDTAQNDNRTNTWFPVQSAICSRLALHWHVLRQRKYFAFYHATSHMSNWHLGCLPQTLLDSFWHQKLNHHDTETPHPWRIMTSWLQTWVVCNQSSINCWSSGRQSTSSMSHLSSMIVFNRRLIGSVSGWSSPPKSLNSASGWSES